MPNPSERDCPVLGIIDQRVSDMEAGGIDPAIARQLSARISFSLPTRAVSDIGEVDVVLEASAQNGIPDPTAPCFMETLVNTNFTPEEQARYRKLGMKGRGNCDRCARRTGISITQVRPPRSR